MKRNHAERVAWTAAGTYAAVGIAWVLLTDLASTSLLGNVSLGTNMMKGSLFVLISSAVLYLVLRRYIRRLDAAAEHAREAEHMRSLGAVAASISHEFNNILMGSRWLVEALARRAGSDPQTVSTVATLRETFDRAERITREILEYSRPRELQLQDVVLSEWAAGFRESIHGFLDERTTLQFDCDTAGLTIRADTGRLHQAFLNLLINARDAMPDGGIIRMRCARATAAIVRELDLPISPSGFIHVSVHDQGQGVPPENLAHIFEPLFTTKPSGTGLGLPIVHQIVTQHGGYIVAKSEEGKGTTFHLFFPVA